MKARLNRLALVRSFAVAAALVAALIAALPATAAVYTWDNGTHGMGGPTDGSGTWSLSSANWWYGSGYQSWTNSTDTAQFGFLSGNSNPYTVTLDPAGVNAGGVIFQDQAYALIGSTLTLGTASGAPPTITVNAASATIDSTIAGSSGLTVTGAGTLTLGGANTYSGSTSINAGTLSLDFTQPGAPATNILNSSSALNFGAGGSLTVQALNMVTGGSAVAQTINGITMAATGGLGAVTSNGGTLNLGPIGVSGSTGSGGPNGDYMLFKVQNGAVITTTAGNNTSGATLLAGRNFGGFGVIDTVTAGNDSYAFAYSTSAAGSVGVIAPASTTAMPTSGASNTTNYLVTGSLNYTNAGNIVVGSLNISSASAGTLTLNGGSNQFRCRAGVILQGNSNFTISSTNGTTFTGPNVEDDPFWIMGSGNLTLAMPFVDNAAGGSATGIAKLGPGTLTIAASSTATGPTFLDQGTIVLGAGAALPSGGFSSAPGTTLTSNPGAGQLVKLMGNSAGVTNNGYSGGGTINGTVTISSGSLQIGGNGESINTSVNGPGTLVLGGGNGLVSLNATPANAGGTFINGSGNVAVNIPSFTISTPTTLGGQFYVGDNGGAGNVTVSGGTFNVGSWFEVGRLYGSTASNTTTSTCTITGPGTVVNTNTGGGTTVEIGWSNGSGGVTTGILNVVNGATFNTNGGLIALGQDYNGGSGQAGILTVGSGSSDTASLNLGGGFLQIGNNPGSSGTLTVKGGTVTCGEFYAGNNGGTGNVTISGGTLIAGSWFEIGRLYSSNATTSTTSSVTITGPGTTVIHQAGGSHAEIGWSNGSGGVADGILNVLNGATFNTENSDIHLGVAYNGGSGQVGTVNLGNGASDNAFINLGSGGFYIGDSSGATGVVNINSGTLNTGGFYVGNGGSSSGTISMSGGTVLNSGGLVLGNASGAIATLNLNQGLFQANSISSNGGSGYLNFNGGTLQVSGGGGYLGAQNGGSLNFYVGQSPAVIDTNGNSLQAVTPFVPNPANSGTDGGLIKLGAGALAISPTNGTSTYQGPTQVSGGTLLVTGGFTNTSSISVASGATFGGDGATSSIVLAASSTLAPGYTILNPLQVGTISPAALTSNGGILSFKLSNTAASGNDQIDVGGNVSLTNVTFNISNLLNGALQSGSYELLSYGSTTALSNLHLSGLPLSRQTYSLDTTSVPDEILLDVSAASPGNLVWLGTNGTTWNTSTVNWYNTSAGSVDKFYNLDNVSFTDQGAAHGNISIASSYSVGALNVSLTSAASSYTFSGPGYLMGVTGLVTSGNGSVTFNTPNTLTGETDLHGGNLSLGASGAIGDASGTNFTYIGGPSVGDSASVAVHSGGTLSGASILLGYASGSTGALTQNGGVVNVVSGTMTVGNSGAGVVTQSGGVVNIPNWLRLGEGATGTGLANISGGTLNVGQRTFIGEMGGGTLNLNGNAVMSSGNVELGMPVDNLYPATPGTGVLNVSDNAVLNISSEIGIGRGGGTGLVTIGGNASVTVGFTIDVGDSNNNSVSPQINFGTSSGTLVQTGGTLTGTSGAQMLVGQYDQPYVNSGLYNFSGGVLNLSNWLVVGNAGGSGVMNIGGSAVLNTTGEVHIGDGADVGPSTGTLNIGGNAVMTVNNWVAVGRGGGNGVVNMTGGLFTQQGNGNFLVGTDNNSQGTFNQSGGTVNAVNQLLVPQDGNSNTLGTYNLSGSGVIIANSWLAVGRDGGAGNFNFSGGTITHANNGAITIGSGGTGVFTMSGGLIVDSAPAAFVGEASNGTLNISGGAAHFNQIEMGVNGGNTAELDLSGGLLSTTQIYLNNASSTATLHLAGGSLQAASGAAANFMSGLTAAYLDSGITTIDTNGQTITVGQPLLAGSGSGGFTKVGAGMLTLAGASTYTGPTVVSAGTLQLGLGGIGVGTLAHRWSFDQGTTNDSVGGVNAIENGNATTGPGGVTITGDGTVGQNYVSLGNGGTPILPTTNSPYTIQVWATQNGLQGWSRIWDFGNLPGTNNLVWSWTQGTNSPGVFAVNGANNNTAAFGTGTQYNMTLTATPSGSGTTYDWYVYGAAGNLVGSGSVATTWNISQMTQANMWLGRSEYGDQDADATYSEVRIFDAALASSQVAALNAAGPSATLGLSPILPAATALTVAPNATLDLNGSTQQVGSISGAGLVTNSASGDLASLIVAGLPPATTFTGTIQDGLSQTMLTVSGGSLTLSGTNSFTGGTTVEGNGTLIVEGNDAIDATGVGTNLYVGNDLGAFFSEVVPAGSAHAAVATAAVPEPGTLALAAAGAVIAIAVRRKSRKILDLRS